MKYEKLMGGVYVQTIIGVLLKKFESHHEEPEEYYVIKELGRGCQWYV